MNLKYYFYLTIVIFSIARARYAQQKEEYGKDRGVEYYRGYANWYDFCWNYPGEDGCEVSETKLFNIS